VSISQRIGWLPHPAKSLRLRTLRGFSLVELMVAITIGLLIVAALLALYLNITRTNAEMAKANSLIENGRFAIQLIQNDLVHAGFWGAHVPQFDDLTFAATPTDAPSATVPNPCLDYSTPWSAAYKNDIVGIPVQAYGATPPSGPGCVTNFATNKQVNTDVLVVRHAETCLPSVGNCEAYTANELYFQAPFCSLEGGYILDPAPDPVPDPALDPALDPAQYTLHKKDCVGTGTPPALPITSGTPADIRKFISNIYYVRDYAVTAGDGIPTLMRSQFDLVGGTLAHQAAQPLIEGIEGFSVELGVDSVSDSGGAVVPTAAIVWADSTTKTSPTNRGDGIPDGAFIPCTDALPCTADQLTNVAAVKLYVLARDNLATPGYTDTKTYTLGSTTLGPFSDSFKRHVFSTTVRLINVSGRRETP
jgi:type IV pilus assembly protein PilW